MALEGYPLGRRERSRASGEKPPMVGRFVPTNGEAERNRDPRGRGGLETGDR